MIVTEVNFIHKINDSSTSKEILYYICLMPIKTLFHNHNCEWIDVEAPTEEDWTSCKTGMKLINFYYRIL